jgi:MarR family transcriptional regulator for hemolysin
VLVEAVNEAPRLGRLLAFANKSVQGSLDRQLAAQGSSIHTWLVLRQVDRHPGLTQRALAETVGIEGPTLTHHLDRLTAEGLVERLPHANDRRAWTVHLTAAGRRHLTATDAVADDHNAALAAALSPAELATVSSALARLTELYGAPAEPRTPADPRTPAELSRSSGAR